jgi:hypothetical protein
MDAVTWYIAETGDPVDPAECVSVDGVLTHKSGVRIAMRFPDCPQSRSIYPGDLPPPAEGGDEDQLPAETAEMKPEPPPAPKGGRGYKTRESKAG